MDAVLSPHLPHASTLYYLGDESRGLMNNGNFSVRFVPLIAVMATVVPQLLTRIRQAKPTQTVAAKDVSGFRNARVYLKESIDMEFCKSVKAFEFKAVPKYPQFFYMCEEIGNHCFPEIENRPRNLENSQHLIVGKIRGNKGCYILKLYKCPNGFEYTDMMDTTICTNIHRKK